LLAQVERPIAALVDVRLCQAHVSAVLAIEDQREALSVADAEVH
jgi:hypothetical protein